MSEVLVVIPVYNHGATLRAVAEGALAVHPHLLVLDDGSDSPVEPLLSGLDLKVIRHEENRGKGAAIRSAALYASEQGFSHIITIDADGQHEPAELPRFLSKIKETPGAFIVGARDFINSTCSVGCIPLASIFGRKFSEFWMFLQTGKRVDDMQSGYRAYPVAALKSLTLRDDHYSFEVEVLVKAAWAGFDIVEIPVSVYYAGPERISHFKLLEDNLRITALNTRLTIRALIPVPFKHLTWDKGGKVSVRRPLQSLKMAMENEGTPLKLAVSTLIPVVVCALPILGFQSIAVLFLIAVLRLNRLWALAVTHACFPPLMPAFCIEVGHYINHGVWLTDISWRSLGLEVGARFWDWLVGALVGGPILGLSLGILVYLVSAVVGKGLRISEVKGESH